MKQIADATRDLFAVGVAPTDLLAIDSFQHVPFHVGALAAGVALFHHDPASVVNIDLQAHAALARVYRVLLPAPPHAGGGGWACGWACGWARWAAAVGRWWWLFVVGCSVVPVVAVQKMSLGGVGQREHVADVGERQFEHRPVLQQVAQVRHDVVHFGVPALDRRVVVATANPDQTQPHYPRATRGRQGLDHHDVPAVLGAGQHDAQGRVAVLGRVHGDDFVPAVVVGGHGRKKGLGRSMTGHALGGRDGNTMEPNDRTGGKGERVLDDKKQSILFARWVMWVGDQWRATRSGTGRQHVGPQRPWRW